MDNKKLMPQQAQPVNRITTGQLPSELAELDEEALSDSASVLASSPCNWAGPLCSYDGEDAE
ncbi:DUF5837 family cyanobactin class RiPP [Microseira wollei]|uniref:Microcyclamide/patellamide family RiPP n=1 Tax=Microseira wollei NIES-4236 TaxID=2530354 RepID=A0AAV3XMZ4_9CYAN|nr:DUF5837 family cyanobactin class RiPP [Microseira wollei]GET40932.1 hypothetical protein MiSe_57440 [Microseira wollei NIES-4236]